MIIEVPKISEEGSRYQGVEGEKILDLETDPLCREDGFAAYDLFAQVVGSELIVRGTVSVPVKLRCSLCADFFSTTLADSSFLRACPLAPGQDVVDLTDDIRETLALMIPLYPRGEPDEHGCCRVCGRDLSKGFSFSDGTKEDLRWSGLDKFSLENPGS